MNISWPPQQPVVSVDQWFYIVNSKDNIIFGTPACLALGIIDDQWPLSLLEQQLKTSEEQSAVESIEDTQCLMTVYWPTFLLLVPIPLQTKWPKSTATMPLRVLMWMSLTFLHF